MRKMTSFISRYALCLLCVLSLQTALTSCAGKELPPPAPDSIAPAPAITPAPAPPQSQDAAGESTDLACSYFYFLWGSHAESNNKYSEAQEAYEKALICDPDAEYILKKLPVLLIKMGKQQAAAQWLREATKKNPDDIDSQLLLARLDINSGDMNEAILIYEKILELAPDNSTVRLRLGYLYSQQGRYKEGEKTIKLLLIKDPNSYFALLYLARLAIQSADYDTAATLYEKILPLNWSPELVYEMAEFYGMREQYKRVEQLYASILAKEPGNEQAALGRVHALLLIDQEQKALEELTRIRALSSKPTDIDLISSRILIRMQNFDKANVLLEKILAREESSAARYMLAVIRYEQNKQEAALAHLRKISHDDKEFENSIALQTKILSELKRAPEAIALLKKLIESANRRQPLYYSLLAGVHVNQNQLASGHEILKKGIERYPDNVQLFFEYGLLLEQEGKQNEAISSMEKVIELQSDHVEALNYLGYTWADNNVHLKKALEYIKKAIALKPDNGYILDSLGWVYFHMGDLEKARIELEHAIALEPDDPYIQEHLGDIYQASGQKKKALTAYRRAKELFKELQMKEKIQQKIDEIK
ncbi:MAG: tetratricopeptide repeat protein [Proteobacteria bacterium]|jgi:tetratricopeptide (TPR) repeat protein|nr:tetratricopeptide repeat protein [Desulfocapsa sp.]MBU3945707.1 tetratricopeptide repeat protein [Pseudomonadota bacterium]MCG2745030.1 tetratricopeptide repeat protein [Desulfobacteraceae bacterium]MBU3982854.1 tetratricopeptide repeat protein [Pseudomonadota bacterium]MBU4027425.1 tetratricopeptide repeat protein [Pseudomonadota bacterium]